MKRGLLTTIFLCAMGIARAQLTGADANYNLQNADVSMFRSFDNRYEGIKGSPTVFDNFVRGRVKMKKGNNVAGQELNYDAVAGELITRSKVYNKILAVRPDLIESFELISPDGDTLIFKRAADKGFCQQIYEGKKMNLYFRHVKQLSKANYGGGYNANARNYDEFVDASEYMISLEGGRPEVIKPARKTFEKIFPEKKDLISGYFKEHKPDLKNNRELAAFLAYLDQNS
jgi:hypothetical protein